jgi:uncharacterized protein
MEGFMSQGSNNGLAAVLCHLGAAFATCIPLCNIVVPLVFLALYKDDAFVHGQAKEALNFQISVLIWAVVGFVLCFVLVGFVVLFMLAIWAIVMPIIAAIKSGGGDAYRYPLTLRLV